MVSQEKDSRAGQKKGGHLLLFILIVLIIVSAVILPNFIQRSERDGDDNGDDKNAGGDDENGDDKNGQDDGQGGLPDDEEYRDETFDSIMNATYDYLVEDLSWDPKEPMGSLVWELDVSAYHHGEVIGSARGVGSSLTTALEEAATASLPDSVTKNEYRESYFRVTFRSPIEHSILVHEGEGNELHGDLVVVRYMDKEVVKKRIDESKEYLFRMIDPNLHGAHKYYYALEDEFEDRLHTIYTSSLTFTLLKMYDLEGDERTWEYIMDCSEFILSMQNTDKDSKRYGGFHYSYHLDDGEKEKKYVVGTTSKTIFTLLELYNRTKDERYLESAILGANWLLTMQNPDGSMTSYVKYKDGKWYHSTGFSCLYNGQVLSALSRIYRVTGNEDYYDAAKRIADNLMDKVEMEGCYLGDDYRPPNPISSSWSILSLFDFYLACSDDTYLDTVLHCSDDLLRRQYTDPGDILDFGRWKGSYTTSGNGWLNEVFTELHNYCLKEGLEDCARYKEAIINVTRWTMQNTYTEASAFLPKDPPMAIGGLFWNDDERYVRTDSVCHGINAYVGIYEYLDEGPLVDIPYPSFDELLVE